MLQNFTQQLIYQAKLSPEKVIINIHIDREYQQITYQDLVTGALAYQNRLIKNDINQGDIVVIILPHGKELIYAYFGCVLNGSIPSIMPYLTEKLIPDKYKQDLHALFSITQPECIITYQEFSNDLALTAKASEINSQVLLVEDIPFGKNGNLFKDFELNLAGWKKEGSEIALLQHSSGTTGLQKGVALSHRAIFNQLESYSDALKIQADDVIVSWLPLYHDMGLIAGFLMPIFMGIPLVIMSPFDWVRAPYLLMQAISTFKGTLCWLPNFAYNFCAKKIRSRNMDNVDLSSLRAVVNCSEPMRKNSHDMFSKAFAEFGFKQSAIATSYAMAENVFAVTQGGINEPVNYDVIDLVPFQEKGIANPNHGEEPSVTMVSAGKPIQGTEVKIVDKNGKILSERRVGEIILKSNCMLSGYYKREDATRKSFINNWFKTGDYGYLADEELYITGRKKDLIIVGGKNIYPKDIENIVMEINGVHPGRVVAFGVFNETKGTEDVVVIAEIEDDFKNNKDSIASQIRAKVTKESAIALRQVLTVDKNG